MGIISPAQERLSDLYGRLNQILETRTWLESQDKILQREIDELERQIQNDISLNPDDFKLEQESKPELSPAKRAELNNICQECG